MKIKLPQGYVEVPEDYKGEVFLEGQVRETATQYAQALADLVQDLEVRANFKTGNQRGVVDCGVGVYQRAKHVLENFK